MKASQLLLTILLTGSASAVSVQQAFADSYLFDVLVKPAYQQSWNALFRGEKDVDSWLTRYAKTKDGSTSPEDTVQLGGIPYQMNDVCKTHDCGDNQFYVLFAPKGAKAWGLLVKNRKNERFFGKPDDEKKNALRAAAQKVESRISR